MPVADMQWVDMQWVDTQWVDTQWVDTQWRVTPVAVMGPDTGATMEAGATTRAAHRSMTATVAGAITRAADRSMTAAVMATTAPPTAAQAMASPLSAV